MKQLLNYLTTQLVDTPDEIDIQERNDGDTLIYELQVDQDDMGRIIGKNGRVANALRTLMKAAAAKRGVRVEVDIV